MSKLRFHDTLNVGKAKTFSDANEFVNDLKSSRVVLNATIRATHSGYLLNRRVYPGQFMKEGVDTWTTPYKRPVLVAHHQQDGEPIGRVVAATYTQIKQGQEFSQDFKNPSRGQDLGSGYITLTLGITDKQAIEKVLDGRYDTVSTAHTSESAHCSICGFNYLNKKADSIDSYCEHEPGLIYEIDGEEFECFVITGKMKYDEVSYVNMPAQPNVKTLALNLNQMDSYLGGKPIESFDNNCVLSRLSLQDADGDLVDLLLKDGQKDSLPDIAGKMISKHRVSVNVTSDRDSNMKKGATKAASSIIQSLIDESVKEEQSQKQEEKKEDNTDVVSELDAALYNIANSIVISNLLLEDSSDCEFSADQVKEMSDNFDKKLSTEQRSKLKASTFCGPDKSFPVPDCAHVTAARRLIGRAKLSADEKKKVLSCVASKAKKFGCNGDESFDKFMAEYYQPEQPAQQEAPKEPSKDATKAETVTKQDKPNVPVQDVIADLVKERDTLTEQVRKLQSGLDSKTQLCNDLSTEVVKLKADQIKETARQLAIIRINLGKQGATGIDSKEKFEDYVDKLSKRSLASLKDSISDLLPELSDLMKNGGAKSLLLGKDYVENPAKGRTDKTNTKPSSNDNNKEPHKDSLVSKDTYLDKI